MKDIILKIAGVKSEKEFYKKFPTEELFMRLHGAAFKKAQAGFGFKQPGIPEVNYDLYPGYVHSSALPDADELASIEKLKGPGPSQDDIIKQNQQITEAGQPQYNKLKTPGTPFGANDALGLIGGVGGAVSSFLDERKRMKEAQMWKGVTDLQLKASKTRPEQVERKYVRPEDQIITGEELFPIYGVGTNPIAKSGTTISNPFIESDKLLPDNLMEIENEYDELDPFMDEGYEPLNDSNVKQFQMGGDIASAFSNPINSYVQTAYDNNAGYQIGNTVGQAAKFIPGAGPIVSAIASPVLGAIGGQLDNWFGPAGKIKKAQAATNRNISQIALGQQAASVQAGLASHLRAGGNMRLNNPPIPTTTMEEGGELQTHWGGYAEPISYNPFLPEGGETVMFRGNSHTERDGKGNTGIGISYGDKSVEVERGEPGMKMQNGSNDPDFVVFGNIPIGKEGAELLGDPKAKDKRFKNYIADLSKKESNYTKTLDKNTKALNDLEVYDSFDKLKFDSLEANMKGSAMSLKEISEKKKNAAHLQNAINETRDQFSQAMGRTISAEDLGRGKVKADMDPVTMNAKKGKTIKKENPEDIDPPRGAKGNVNVTKYTHTPVDPDTIPYTPMTEQQAGSMFASPEAYAKYKADVEKTYQDPKKAQELVNYFMNYEGPGWQQVRAHMSNLRTPQERAAMAQKLATDYKPGPYHIDIDKFFKPASVNPIVDEVNPTTYSTPPIIPEKSNWWNLIGAAMPYLRPSTKDPLDPNQLMGEMYALSNNQVEPVYAQSFQPQLRVPYDISLQDQLNEVTAQTRAAQRMAGYNPAAQAMIASQAYEPANRILGEQFRLNQAMKDQVYTGNINTLNEARKLNLGLYDQQAQRQSQAVSNTKAVNQAALNSISSKYLQNKLEERKIQTMENLYNYRFGPQMRAYNVNAPWTPNIPTVYQEGEDYTYIPEKASKETTTKKSKEKTTSRNGSLVSALKRM